MLDATSPMTLVAGLVVGYVAWSLALSWDRNRRSAIPTVGRGFGVFAAIDSIVNCQTRIQEGYDKYAPSSQSFKVPQFDSSMVVVLGQRNLQELKSVPEGILSIQAAVEETLALEYTFGKNFGAHHYDLPLIKEQLTRSIPALLPDLLDEVRNAFGHVIKLDSQKEWTKLNANEAVKEILCRSANRILVGLPTCREQEYLRLGEQTSMNMIIAGLVVGLFPEFMKPLVGRSVSRSPQLIDRGMKFLRPVIDARRQLDPADRPNDFLSWVLAEGDRYAAEINEPILAEELVSYEFITKTMLALGVAILQSTSMAFTSALYHLAGDEKRYLEPLREEVEQAVKEHGWTTTGLSKMPKLDSFFKETLRWSALGSLSVRRKALEDYTFADGTFVPKGSYVSTPLYSMQRDDARYPSASEFDGYRFFKMSQGVGEGTKSNTSTKYQLSTPTPDFLVFGFGPRSCPGRFFVSHLLKLAMGHLLLNYDVKMENNGTHPEGEWLGTFHLPNRKAEVMFRRRESANVQ